MWDLSSPTRDRICVPFIGRQILNHWTTREVPGSKFWVEPKRWPLLAISNHRSKEIAIFLLWVLLSTHSSRVHLNLVLMGHGECNMQTGQQEWQTHILCIFTPIPLPMLCCLGYYSFIGRLKVSYCQSSDILFQDYFDCYRFCTFPYRF